MEFMDKVSKRIVELREAKGETQQELADAIGITRQSLSRYEIATRTINVDVLGALAQHFNVTTDYLLGLSDVKSTEKDMKIACEVTGLMEETILKIRENTLDARTIDVLVTSIIETDAFKETTIITLISNYFGSANPNIAYDIMQKLSLMAFDEKSILSEKQATNLARMMFDFFIEKHMLYAIEEALKCVRAGFLTNIDQEDTAHAQHNPKEE